jgi:L-fuconolactonase
LRRDFMPEEAACELRSCRFDGAIAVQAAQSLGETEFLLGLAAAHPFIVGVVGWVDLRARDAGDVLGALAGHPAFKGVRHIVQSEPSSFLAEASCRAGVKALSPFDLSYNLLVSAHQLPEAVDFVTSLPDVRFVLDHLAKPPVRSAELEPWRTQLRRMAEVPNVCCKLSGLVTEAVWDGWQPTQLVPFIDAAVELFGASRLLVGSDWPVCTLAGSYAEVMRVFDDYFAHFSDVERAAIFGENAAREYRIRPAA